MTGNVRSVPTGRSRRDGRMPGLLVYATGVMVVLSAVCGVSTTADSATADSATAGSATAGSATAGGAQVVTDSTGSVRALHAKGVAEDKKGRASETRANRRASTRTAVPASASAPEPDVETEEDDAETEAATEATASPPPSARTAPSTSPRTTSSSRPTTTTTTTTTAPPPAAVVPAPVGAPGATVPAGTWLSGASGVGVADGTFAAWRGSALPIAGTWSDNNEAMTELWQLHPGEDFGSWDQSLDIAIGAIGDGESWQRAAQGAYDARWRESLTNLRSLWSGRSGTLYIRFAHEMNGNWYPWSVDAGDRDAFIASWKHFRALQKEIFPAAKLVFCVNRESVGSGFDWRQLFPGTQYVDVMAVDYYNQYPYVGDAGDWAETVDATDGYGAPKGLQQHLDFARSVGLPLAVPEWSGNADEGDSPAWIAGMHGFFSRNAGGGAGQVVYDVVFNEDKDGGRWLLFGGTRMPQSATAYRAAF